MKRLYLLLLILLSLPLAAELNQSLVGADSLFIGDNFIFNIDSGTRLKDITLPDTLKDFRLLEQKEQQYAGGFRYSLKLMVLNLGALSFPKLELKPLNPLHKRQSTDGFRVYVLGVRAESDSLLRDIKPLLKEPFQLPFWLYLLLTLLCILLGIYLLLKALKRRPKDAPPPVVKEPEVPQIPAWTLALGKLEKLLASGLLERDVVEFHFQLSALLREYLKAAYSFNALEMTTFEIRETMRQNPLLFSASALDLLSYCDRIKFAKWLPETKEIQELIQSLRQYLQKEGEQSGV